MALPPRLLGTHARLLRVEQLGERRWRAIVGETPLPPLFESEGDALAAGEAEVARLDALSLALLARIRSRSSRKQG